MQTDFLQLLNKTYPTIFPYHETNQSLNAISVIHSVKTRSGKV